MTDPSNQHDDLAWVHADDVLLDVLGTGEVPPGDDEVAAMLAAWRADLAADLPALRTAAPAPGSGERTVDLSTVDRRAARPRMRGARALAVAASLVLIAALGGVLVAALHATPGSPLWPISQILNPQRADVLTAQDTLDKARTAITQHRYADAGRLLDLAQAQISRVRGPQDAARLRAELEALRLQLAELMNGTPTAPLAPTAPATPVPTQPPGAGGSQGGGGGQPGHGPTTGGGGGLVPGLPLPSLPLPSLPVPVPSLPHLPLPSLPLPSLPLPSLPIHLP